MESKNVRVKSLRLTKRYPIKANGEGMYSFNQSNPQQQTGVSGRLHSPADVTLGYNVSVPVLQRLFWSEMLRGRCQRVENPIPILRSSISQPPTMTCWLICTA